MEQQEYLAKFWQKYEVLERLAPKQQTTLQNLIPFLDVAHRTWLRSQNTGAQAEADIQHHVELQQQFFQLREREHDILRANAPRH